MCKKCTQSKACGSLSSCLPHMILLSNPVLLYSSLFNNADNEYHYQKWTSSMCSGNCCSGEKQQLIMLMYFSFLHVCKDVMQQTYQRIKPWLYVKSYSCIYNWSCSRQALHTAVIILSTKPFQCRTSVAYLLSKYVIKRLAYCSDYYWLGHAVTGSL